MGAGRPRTIESRESFTLALPRDVLEALRASAKAEGVSVADVVRSILARSVRGRRPRPRRSKTSRS